MSIGPDKKTNKINTDQQNTDDQLSFAAGGETECKSRDCSFVSIWKRANISFTSVSELRRPSTSSEELYFELRRKEKTREVAKQKGSAAQTACEAARGTASNCEASLNEEKHMFIIFTAIIRAAPRGSARFVATVQHLVQRGERKRKSVEVLCDGGREEKKITLH